jgi:nitrogen regulatory protein P-II 1
MKKIEAIIRPDRVSEVCTALDNLGHHGVTLSHVEEQGGQKGWVNQVRGISQTVNLLSKVRVDIAVKDEDVERIIHVIRNAAMTGEAGDGNIFVHDMADAIRIRTSESGMAAI